jgi:hypothetical protein
MQVSMMSTPASMALRWLMGDMPEVKVAVQVNGHFDSSPLRALTIA